MLRLPSWLRRRKATGSGVYCVFRFPDSTESRWLERLPEPGTRIRTRTGRVWVVDEVLQSGRETYTVYCVARRVYAERLRYREGDLAAELLEAARHTSEAVTTRRHRRRYRPFRP